jgi:FkbM family methyltransferase
LPTAPSSAFRAKAPLEIAGERFRSAPVSPRVRRWLRHLYHRALMVQSAGRGLACSLPGGEAVRVLPEHRHIAWNPTEYAAFRDAARPGQIALDVGANVGAYALVLGRWVGATGRVYAFEPAVDMFRALADHISLNDLGRTVRAVPLAVADSDGEAGFSPSPTAGEGRLLAQGESGRPMTVTTTTIDAFCAAEGILPDFIKIDVEGWELAALRGARATIRARGAGLSLFVELHPSIWPALGVSREDWERELALQALEMSPLTQLEDPWAVEGISVRLSARPATRGGRTG